jgi:hypothetical protein
MRRVWASILAVWSTLAIVAVLAWSHAPPVTPSPATPVTVLVQGKNGRSHLAKVFVLPSTATAHTATHSSPVR